MDMRNRRVNAYRSPRLIVDFEMNRAGMARVAVGQELKDATRQIIRERAMPYAISISPVGDRDQDTGGKPRYIESFRIAEGHTVIAGMRRVAAKLINVAPHAAAVEFLGTNPHASGYAVLGRTLEHLNGHGGAGTRGLGKGRARAPWRPELHYRGPGGRFATKPKN